MASDAPVGQCSVAFEALLLSNEFFVPSPKIMVSDAVGLMSTGWVVRMLTPSMVKKTLRPAGMIMLVSIGFVRLPPESFVWSVFRMAKCLSVLTVRVLAAAS